jgi:hypothetical protein
MESGVHYYYPEMGQPAPECKIEAELAHYGKHYFLRTAETLSGRGVEFIKTYTERDRAPYLTGRNLYKVTIAAFEKLKDKYTIGYELLLD